MDKEYLLENVGGWYVRWMCKPPDYDVKFIVKKEDWTRVGDTWTRNIYHIEIVK